MLTRTPFNWWCVGVCTRDVTRNPVQLPTQSASWTIAWYSVRGWNIKRVFRKFRIFRVIFPLHFCQNIHLHFTHPPMSMLRQQQLSSDCRFSVWVEVCGAEQSLSWGVYCYQFVLMMASTAKWANNDSFYCKPGLITEFLMREQNRSQSALICPGLTVQAGESLGNNLLNSFYLYSWI